MPDEEKSLNREEGRIDAEEGKIFTTNIENFQQIIVTHPICARHH